MISELKVLQEENGRLRDKNDNIADWLLRLTGAHRNWALGYAFNICAILKVYPGTINETLIPSTCDMV